MAGFWKKALAFGAKPLQHVQHRVEQGVSHLPGMNDQRAAALTKALGGGIGENGLPGQPRLPGMPGGAKIPGLPNLPSLPGMTPAAPPPPGEAGGPIGMMPTPMPVPGGADQGTEIQPGPGQMPVTPMGPVPVGNKLPIPKQPTDYTGTNVSSAKGLAGGIPMRGGGGLV